MQILKEGERLIAYEEDITAGPLGVNDAFDLYLVQLKDGNYKLIVFMKIQFFFEDYSYKDKKGKKHVLKWTDQEKRQFVAQWKSAIQNTWGNRILKVLSSGKRITIEFRFETLIEGWSITEHWEITVTKTNHFMVSSVNTFFGNVYLDSLDLQLTSKGKGQRQRGVIHEFGHMLGLNDEYLDKSPHHKDYQSVMNRGEKILRRHDNPYMKWLEKTLREKNIR